MLLRISSILLVICTTFYSAQAQNNKDTLALARTLAYNKEFQKADALLSAYQAGNPNQYTLQLHALVLYWMKQYDRCAALYQKGLQQFPGYTDLRLDYSRMLYQTGKLKEAEEQLQFLVQQNSLHAEANIMLANLFLWKGDVAAAKQKIMLLQQTYPDNQTIIALHEAINNSYAPYLKGGYSYLSDDQPVTANLFQLEAGFNKSALMAPYAAVTANQFTNSNAQPLTTWARAGNTFQLGYGSTAIRAEAGVFRAGARLTSFTGTVAFNQKLSSTVRLQLSASQLPYQFTFFSTIQPFTYRLFTGAIEFNRQDRLTGKAGVELQSFDDGASVTTGYTWLLVPIVRQQSVSFKAGYGFSYSNATRNAYQSGKPLNQVVATQGPYTQVQGVYVPYFTPQKQVVHSLLASTQFSFSKRASLNIQGSVGVVAAAENPVLLLEKNTGNNYFISKSFYKQQYTPFEVEANVNTALSAHFSLQARYQYSKLFFYARNVAGLQLSYRFF